VAYSAPTSGRSGKTRSRPRTGCQPPMNPGDRRLAGVLHDLAEQEPDVELCAAVRYFDPHLEPAAAAHQLGVGQAVEAAAADPAGWVDVGSEQHAIERVDDGGQHHTCSAPCPRRGAAAAIPCVEGSLRGARYNPGM